MADRYSNMDPFDDNDDLVVDWEPSTKWDDRDINIDLDVYEEEEIAAESDVDSCVGSDYECEFIAPSDEEDFEEELIVEKPYIEPKKVFQIKPVDNQDQMLINALDGKMTWIDLKIDINRPLLNVGDYPAVSGKRPRKPKSPVNKTSAKWAVFKDLKIIFGRKGGFIFRKRVEKINRPCRFILDGLKCPFGNNCKFIHDCKPNPNQGFRQGPPNQGFRQGPPNQGFRQGPPPNPNQGFRQGPNSRQGPPHQGFRQGPPHQVFRQGPPHQVFRQGPPHQVFRQGPPNQGFRHGPPPNQGFRQGPPNQELEKPQQIKKLKFCTSIVRTGKCSFENKCMFAHTMEEVANTVRKCPNKSKCPLVEKQKIVGDDGFEVVSNSVVYVNINKTPKCMYIHNKESIKNYVARTM